MFGEGFVGGAIALINIRSPLHFAFLNAGGIRHSNKSHRTSYKKIHLPARFGGGYANLDLILQVVWIFF